VPGPQGPAGVTQITTRTTTFTFPQSNGATGQLLDGHAQCQVGEKLVSGGFDLSNNVSVASQPNVIVTRSRPALANGSAPGNNGSPTGWYAQARRNSDTAATTVTVYAVCASA
jgi:hypothetical protein